MEDFQKPLNECWKDAKINTALISIFVEIALMSLCNFKKAVWIIVAAKRRETH